MGQNANKIAPTLVGGSKKHGGPDLGPVRARNAWAELGVDGRGVANMAPEPDFEGMPRLTSRMLARIQGFPDTWTFGKKKTAACLYDWECISATSGKSCRGKDKGVFRK